MGVLIDLNIKLKEIKRLRDKLEEDGYKLVIPWNKVKKSIIYNWSKIKK